MQSSRTTTGPREQAILTNRSPKTGPRRRARLPAERGGARCRKIIVHCPFQSGLDRPSRLDDCAREHPRSKGARAEGSRAVKLTLTPTPDVRRSSPRPRRRRCSRPHRRQRSKPRAFRLGCRGLTLNPTSLGTIVVQCAKGEKERGKGRERERERERPDVQSGARKLPKSQACTREAHDTNANTKTSHLYLYR